jgi:hypothetical protein
MARPPFTYLDDRGDLQIWEEYMLLALRKQLAYHPPMLMVGTYNMSVT